VIRKNLFIFLLYLILGCGLAEAGPEMIAVQSLRVKPYEEAINGLESVCKSRIDRLVISELQGTDIAEKVKEIKPALVFAVGLEALLRVKEIKDIPVVYLMVLDPYSTVSRPQNIAGVSMQIPPAKQLTALVKVLPHVKRVGLLYNPDRMGHFVKRARAAAGKKGLKLIAHQVHGSGEVPFQANNMRGKIDVFWMLPDITVVMPEAVEFLLLFSLENKIPLLTFSDKYVESGAFMSVGIDPFDIGRQAGEMADAIRTGKDIKDLPQVDARKVIISINPEVAKKLGIHLDQEIINNAKIAGGEK
jgi:putative ABC transport system substrate-binding protein